MLLKKKRLFWIFPLLLLSLTLLLAACGPSDEGDDEPQPAATQQDSGYPAADGAAYPGVAIVNPVADLAYPSPDDDLPGKFKLDLPLQAGATTVTGQAPPDLLIGVVDVTYGGVLLGTGRSDGDGRFAITVSALPENHRVGITFAELPPGKTVEEMSIELFPYRGEGFINVPNVGIFFDSAMTQP